MLTSPMPMLRLARIPSAISSTSSSSVSSSFGSVICRPLRSGRYGRRVWRLCVGDVLQRDEHDTGRRRPSPVRGDFVLPRTSVSRLTCREAQTVGPMLPPRSMRVLRDSASFRLPIGRCDRPRGASWGFDGTGGEEVSQYVADAGGASVLVANHVAGRWHHVGPPEVECADCRRNVLVRHRSRCSGGDASHTQQFTNICNIKSRRGHIRRAVLVQICEVGFNFC